MSNSAAAEVNATFSILLLVCSITTGIFHWISVRKHNKSRKDAQAHGDALVPFAPSLVVSNLLIGVAIVSGVSLTMDSVLTSKLCRYAQFYGPSLYSIFKTLVYVVLCIRIWMRISEGRGVAATLFAYNKRALLCWGAFLVLWTAFTVIAGNLTVTHTLETDSECIVTPSTLYIASQALLDIVSGGVNCALFVAPICKMYKMKADEALKASAYNQCILSVICIVSSIVSMAGIGAAQDFVPVFVALDMMLSTVCVVLMFQWNAPIASRLFCCCVPSVENNSAKTVSQAATPSPAVEEPKNDGARTGMVEVEVIQQESTAADTAATNV